MVSTKTASPKSPTSSPRNPRTRLCAPGPSNVRTRDNAVRAPLWTCKKMPVLAKQCGAEVFLLSVLTDTGTLLLSEVTLAGASVQMEEDFREILDEGVKARL